MSVFEVAMTGYWRSPDAQAMVALFVSPQVGGDWRAENVLTVPVFLAHVLDADPEVAVFLVDAVRGGDAVKVEMVAQALNYSHISARARLMEKLVGEAAAASMDGNGADFAAFTPTHPVHVDMLWASFFATGSDLYLDRITALLDGWLAETPLQVLLARAAAEPEVQAQALAAVLAKAAQMTLVTHGRDCPSVRAALARRAAAMDGLGAALAARIGAGFQS
jgi:hypothetical protein